MSQQYIPSSFTLVSQFLTRRTSRNTLFAAGQSLVVTICIFLIYRMVIAHAGLERFGVWSLLLAGSAVIRIGDVSGAGALARFVAIRIRDGETLSARDTVHTVILTSLAINIVIGTVLLVVAPFMLGLFLAPENLPEARTLVPFVVILMIFGSLAVAVASGLDGTQRADKRSLIIIAAAIINLFASWILIPRFGIIGFAAAQILQPIVIFIVGWLSLRKLVPSLGWVPLYCKWDEFRETTGFAMKLNAIGLLGLMFDPLAKFAINTAGGPGLVALYELASRLILQVRTLAVSAALPMVAVFASKTGPDDIEFKKMLEKMMRITAAAGIIVTVITLVGAPLASMVVLGQISFEMLIMNVALTAGWSLNLLSIGPYLAAEGSGVLRWNLFAHALNAASVLVGAFLIQPIFGHYGLIVAMMIGLILSSSTALFGNAYNLGQLTLLLKLRRWLVSSSLIIVSVCFIYGTILVSLNG